MAVNANPKTRWETWRWWLQAIWVAIALITISLVVARNWHSMDKLDGSVRTWGLLAAALVAALLQKLAGGLRWIGVVSLFTPAGKTVSAFQSLRIYFLSNLAMYLPGTYWFIPLRMAMYRRVGVTNMQTGAGIVIDHFMLIVSGALIGLAGLGYVVDPSDRPAGMVWWLASVVAVGLIAIHPRCAGILTTFLARILRREPTRVTLTYSRALGLLAWSVVVWVFSGFSLLCLAAVFSHELGPADIGPFCSLFAVAWLVGFFTPFAPNGIGIREGLLVLAFSRMGIPAGEGLLIASLFRLALMAADLIWAGVSWLCLVGRPPANSLAATNTALPPES